MTWETLLRNLTGQASPAEQQACRRWLDAAAANQALYRQLQEQHRQRQAPRPAEEVDQEWARLQARIQDAETQATQEAAAAEAAAETPAAEPESALEAPVIPLWRGWLKYAAAVALLLTAATAWWLQLRQPRLITIAAADQRRTVRLPDSSTVWLGRRSSLSYAVDFGQTERTLQLRGEAFFEVTKNPAKPFVVHTPRLAVRVLGTSFHVAARPDGAEEVAVATGVVGVKSATTDNRLYPAQRLVLDRAGRASVAAVAPDDARALKTNTLHFERSSLGQIARQLARWYQIKVSIAPGDTAGVAFSGRIPDTGLPQVLDGLSFATDRSFVLTPEHTIVIKPKANE